MLGLVKRVRGSEGVNELSTPCVDNVARLPSLFELTVAVVTILADAEVLIPELLLRVSVSGENEKLLVELKRDQLFCSSPNVEVCKAAVVEPGWVDV